MKKTKLMGMVLAGLLLANGTSFKVKAEDSLNQQVKLTNNEQPQTNVKEESQIDVKAQDIIKTETVNDQSTNKETVKDESTNKPELKDESNKAIEQDVNKSQPIVVEKSNSDIVQNNVSTNNILDILDTNIESKVNNFNSIVGVNIASVNVDNHLAGPNNSKVELKISINDKWKILGKKGRVVYRSKDGKNTRAFKVILDSGKASKNKVYSAVIDAEEEELSSQEWELQELYIVEVFGIKYHKMNLSEQAAQKGNFVVDFVSPDVPSIVVSTTELTNQNVSVTINGEKNGKIQYKLSDKAEWNDYKGTFSVEENCQVISRVTDNAGNVSENASVDIKNIDKIKPLSPAIEVNTKNPTNQDVVVTISGQEEGKIEYKVSGEDSWKEYKESFNVDKNCTVTARMSDKAGNVSDEASIEILNIDKEKPVVPAITQNNDTAGVIVTITGEKDGKIEYKISGEDAWKTYTESFKVDKSCKVIARVTDAAGNVSDESELSIVIEQVVVANSQLPKTGSFLDMNVFLCIGSMLLLLGGFIALKSRKKNEFQ